MKLSKLGERAIIKNLEKFLDGIGDDCAVMDFGNQKLVLATDMLYKPTDILNEMSWEQRGKLAVTVNFSDIAAMGAKPLAFLLSYGSPDIEYEDFLSLVKGAKKQCERFGAKFIGGDTNQTDELTLAGFALGVTKRPILRSGAKPDDVVCVTGNVGTAALGVQILVKKSLKKIKLESGIKEILRATLEPEPRMNEGLIIGKYANSMMDISDGLAVTLYGIAEKSKVGMKIDSDKIPLSYHSKKISKELGLNLLDFALYGGGDYELVFTVPKNRFAELKRKVKITKIGEVVKGSGVFAGEIKIPNKGYEHFRQGNLSLLKIDKVD